MNHSFDISKQLESILSLVERAGQAVMAVYRLGEQGGEHVGMQLKDDNSPVTQADLAANEILCAGLIELTPQIPVVSEENAGSHGKRRADNMFWLLDPVDGTREFLSRTDEFTVNVALIVNSRVQFGVVQAPALGQLYWGASELGAWRQDSAGRQQIRVADFPAQDSEGRFERDLRIVASRSHMNDATRRHIENLTPNCLLGVGSSLKFCRIAEGQADYYPRLGPTCEWDTAAAQAVVEAAGGQVLTLDGAPLNYGKADVLNPHFLVTAKAP
ncbi:MAG: 3'(2'),5'-bisphosphate nucleotidase CysQ [Burkholderiaceae bacterium]